jgi:P27 family predicted phage terminase small subunit
MKGRKPKPAHLRLVQGNPSGRAINMNEPIARAAVPTAPKYLCAAAKREWKRITPLLHAAGLISHLDQQALGAYCQSVARLAEANGAIATEGAIIITPTGHRRPNPWIAIQNSCLRQVSSFRAEFGLRPSARTRLKVEQQPLDDAFERFLASAGD